MNATQRHKRPESHSALQVVDETDNIVPYRRTPRELRVQHRVPVNNGKTIVLIDQNIPHAEIVMWRSQRK